MIALQTLLTKEMDRREFLLFAGVLLVTITGLAGMTKSINNIISPKAESGFGSNPYGK